MSTLSVDMIEPVGSTLTFGQSGDTMTIPAGATFTNNGAATGFAGGLVLKVYENNLNTTVHHHTLFIQALLSDIGNLVISNTRHVPHND